MQHTVVNYRDEDTYAVGPYRMDTRILVSRALDHGGSFRFSA
jgi:hypothetical protein